MVGLAVAIDQVGGTATNPESIRPLFKGLDHLGVIGQAQVVVAAEIEPLPTILP
jgi:hypothetical protein